MSGRGFLLPTQPIKPSFQYKFVENNNQSSDDEEITFEDAEENEIPFRQLLDNNKRKETLLWPKPNLTREKITENFLPAGACISHPNLPKVYRNKLLNDKNNEVINNNRNAKVSSGRGKLIDRLRQLKIKKEITSYNWDFEDIVVPMRNSHINKENIVEINVENEAINRCECIDCDSFTNCKTWIENNTKFDLASVENVNKGPNFLNFSDIGVVSSLQSIKSNDLFIEGQIIPEPLNRFKNSNIFEALKQIDCYQPNKMQSYTWSAILRRLSVFIIAPEKSGKSIAYIPPLCAIALNIKDFNRNMLKSTGPVILIVCANPERCQKIKNLINNFYEEEKSNFNNYQIFHVTAADKLEIDLKSQKIDLKNVFHFVLDQADCLLKINHKNIAKFLQILNIIQSERPVNKFLQIIVTTEMWTANLEYLLKKLQVIPVVCFGDYLETALYGKIKLVTKKFNSNLKNYYLLDSLEKVYTDKKIIVFCNNDEITQLEEYLQLKNIETVVISNSIDEIDRKNNEIIWSLTRFGYHKVLLCCDEMFNVSEYLINANWLIHYSLPNDLNQFRKRFRSLSHNLQSPLISNNDDENIKSIVIMDEKNNCELYSKLIYDIIARNSVSHLKFEH